MSRTKTCDRLYLRDRRRVTVYCPCGHRLAIAWLTATSAPRGWDAQLLADELLPFHLPDGGVEYLIQDEHARGRVRSTVDPIRWRCTKPHCRKVHEVDEEAVIRQLTAVKGSDPKITLGEEPPPPPKASRSRDW